MLKPIPPPDRQAIEEFIRQPTPRKIPDDFMKRISPDGADNKGCLGPLLAYFLFSMIFVVNMVPWQLPIEVFVRLAPSKTAEGVITHYEGTNSGWKEGKRSFNRKPRNTNYAIYITYRTEDGRRVEFKNHVTGRSSIPGYDDGTYDDDGRALKQAPITLRYFPGLQQWAVADGGRLAVYSPLGLIVLIFPSAALIIYRIVVLPRKRLRKILTRGRTAVADLVSFREYATRRKRGGSVTYAEIIFSFSLDGRPLRAEYHIRRERADALEQAFRNQKKYLILYQADESEPVLPLTVRD